MDKKLRSAPGGATLASVFAGWDMRRIFCVIIVFASSLIFAEPPALPDLSKEMHDAAIAIGAGNGNDLERAAIQMRWKLSDAAIGDNFAAALTLLDLTAGPGTEKLRAVTGRYAVMLAPHLPEAHLYHAQRLYETGFESRYWLAAAGDYFKALDQPLFLWPLRDAAVRPILLGIQIPFFLLLFAFFLRRREELLRRYGLPGISRPIAGTFATYAVPAFATALLAIAYGAAGTFALLFLAALFFPALVSRERWILLFSTLLLLLDYAAVTVLNNLPPPAAAALTTADALLAFGEPGSLTTATVPYLLHEAAFSWMIRYGLFAFFFASFFFLITLSTAFLLARHRVAFCTTCGILIEPGENARADTDICIVCDHIAEKGRQIREVEIRRYREQALLKRRRRDRWALWMAWLIPGAGLVLRDRSWEGAFYLFSIAGLFLFVALWLVSAAILAPYRPPTTAPSTVCVILAAVLYAVSVVRIYLVEHRS